LRKSESRIFPFLLAGGLNTAVTYACFIVIEPKLGAVLSYTLVYTAGICFSYYLNARFVFQSPIAWRSALPFPAIYGVQYLWGVLLLLLLGDVFNWPHKWALLAVIATSVPLTFLLTRQLMVKQ